MSRDTIRISTRKGLFAARLENGEWRLAEPAFLGDNVSAALRHPVSGALAMGSTTGSLWVSADDGGTWQTISSNLPPVYAVRFD